MFLSKILILLTCLLAVQTGWFISLKHLTSPPQLIILLTQSGFKTMIILHCTFYSSFIVVISIYYVVNY